MKPRITQKIPIKKKSHRPIIKQKRATKPNLNGLDINTAKELIETMRVKERISVQRKKGVHNTKK